jgi:hypothetical protein
MNKVAVMPTASLVWSFATERFGTILRLTWCSLSLVLLVQFVASYFIHGAVFDAKTGVILGYGFFIWSMALGFFTTVATTIAIVALHRLILFGDDKAGQYVYLSFGRTEFLFVALPIMAYIVMIILFVVTALITPFLSSLVTLGVSFLFLRMFLIFPIIVVEGRYDFEQAWELGRGNIWRFIGLGLVVFLPVLVVMLIVGFFTGAFSFPDPENIGARPIFGPRMIFDLAWQFVVSIISTSLGVGVLSYSYKAVKGLPPNAPIEAGG